MSQYHISLLEIILIGASLTVIFYLSQNKVSFSLAYYETACDYEVENLTGSGHESFVKIQLISLY